MISIRGIPFKSAAAAASYFGLQTQSVKSMLARGAADRIGLGPRLPPELRNWKGNQRPVTIAGITYPSLREATRQLGLPRDKLYNLRRKMLDVRGKPPVPQALRLALHKYARHIPPCTADPCTCGLAEALRL